MRLMQSLTKLKDRIVDRNFEMIYDWSVGIAGDVDDLQNSPSSSSDPLDAWPVGSVFISVNPTSPTDIFGGTWEQIQDRFILSAGSSYTAGDTGGSAEVALDTTTMPSHTHVQDSHNHTQDAHTHTQNSHNHTQDAHTHTQNSHNHTQNSHNHTQNSHNHTQNSHNHTQDSHTHSVRGWAGTDHTSQNYITGSTYGGGASNLVSGAAAAVAPTINSETPTNQATTATNQSTTATNQSTTATNQNTTATNQAATATNQDATATNQAATATNQSTGGGLAHDNMPPYLVVYMWKRTA